jgi:hypothetical protein
MLVFLALVSLAGLSAAVILPGLSDLALLAGPCLLASLWLLGRGWAQRRRPAVRAPVRPAAHVIVDGSNVMHWNRNVPSLEVLASVIRALEAKGLTPGVMFDANVGHKTLDRYQDDAEMARRLGLPDDQVLVVPKGTPADRYILQAARRLKVPVVTNDRYRDWSDEFPEVAGPGFLIRGGVRDGAVWLNHRDFAATKHGLAGP